MSRIGFALLTHANEHQIRRLAGRLARSFPGAPIACHHDFSQSPIDASGFPPELRFVRPHVPTRWGDFSLVDATLAAFRALRAAGTPDYVVVLSGADYPLKNAQEVLADLDGVGADAFTRLHLVHPDVEAAPHHRYGWPHRRPETLRRYFRAIWRVPLPKILGGPRLITSSKRWITSRLAPYSRDAQCWAGSQWMTLGSRGVEQVLDWHDSNRWLEDYLRHRPVSIADESYIHTILGNARDLRVNDSSFRFYEWRYGAKHPNTLVEEHWEPMLASGAHFGRKFAPDSPLLDRLDERLDATR